MITIHQITKTYPGNIHALSGIDLEIGAGMFGLIGPNGAGKTSLMRILAGLVRPTSGSVHVFGHDLSTPQGKLGAKSLLGYLPQEMGFYPELSGREFLDYIAILKGITNSAARLRQIDELLATVRLSEVAERKLKTYSGGMKRRAGIAQALLGEPRLLIVDEPTVGLDPEERVRLRNLLSETARRCTVILSTHIIEDISQSCNDLAVINHGRVVFRGSPRQLIAQATGKVWLLTTDGEMPDNGLLVVSSLQTQDGVQYRVLGEASPGERVRHVDPSLEDGYIWLMQGQPD